MPESENLKHIDKLLALYASKIPATVYLLKNKERYNEIVLAMDVITGFIKDISPDADIKITPQELNPTAISYCAIIDELIFSDIKAFCSAISAAANFEVYPRTNGKISLNIIFQGAYTPAPPYEEIHKDDKK